MLCLEDPRYGARSDWRCSSDPEIIDSIDTVKAALCYIASEMFRNLHKPVYEFQLYTVKGKEVKNLHKMTKYHLDAKRIWLVFFQFPFKAMVVMPVTHLQSLTAQQVCFNKNNNDVPRVVEFFGLTSGPELCQHEAWRVSAGSVNAKDVYEVGAVKV